MLALMLICDVDKWYMRHVNGVLSWCCSVVLGCTYLESGSLEKKFGLKLAFG